MPCSDDWNAAATPWKLVRTVAGQGVARDLLARGPPPRPSETPGCRLKEMVTAGNWPRWATVSGPTPVRSFATAESGTSLPVADADVQQARARSGSS